MHDFWDNCEQLSASLTPFFLPSPGQWWGRGGRREGVAVGQRGHQLGTSRGPHRHLIGGGDQQPSSPGHGAAQSRQRGKPGTRPGTQPGGSRRSQEVNSLAVCVQPEQQVPARQRTRHAGKAERLQNRFPILFMTSKFTDINASYFWYT